jgi:hypothetical protein
MHFRKGVAFEDVEVDLGRFRKAASKQVNSVACVSLRWVKGRDSREESEYYRVGMTWQEDGCIKNLQVERKSYHLNPSGVTQQEISSENRI